MQKQKDDTTILFLSNLALMARKWRRKCGRPGGACCQQEEINRRSDEIRKECAKDVEDLLKATLDIDIENYMRVVESREWYMRRLNMLLREQSRMRDPERTLVCDILAKGQLLPDPKGKRYGKKKDR